MQEFQQKKKVRRILYSKLALAVLALILLLLARGVWNVYGKYRESVAENAISQKELSNLKSQQASMAADISDLNTSQGVERQIREDYSMVQPGEKLVVIVNNATTTATSTPPTVGFFGRIWDDIKSAF